MRFVLDDKGEGPGQYQMLGDVQFNPHHKRLELWDLSLDKLLFFDLQGKFISEQKINLPIMSFFPVTKDWYAYHSDHTHTPDGSADFLFYFLLKVLSLTVR